MLLGPGGGGSSSRGGGGGVRGGGGAAPYTALWPTAVPADPWAVAYRSLFRRVADLAVLYRTGGGPGRGAGEWIPARAAVVLGEDDDAEDEEGGAGKAGGGGGGAGELTLRAVLECEGLPVVALPPALKRALVDQVGARDFSSGRGGALVGGF